MAWTLSASKSSEASAMSALRASARAAMETVTGSAARGAAWAAGASLATHCAAFLAGLAWSAGGPGPRGVGGFPVWVFFTPSPHPLGPGGAGAPPKGRRRWRRPLGLTPGQARQAAWGEVCIDGHVFDPFARDLR